MTKKEEQYETRKWQILDIALNHFIRYGFYGTSTRKIAEEAGIVFMRLVAINAKDVSERAVQMIQEHDVEAQSVSYIIKGQEMGIIRPGDPLTLSVLFYSSIQGFAEVLANRENLTIPKKEWFLAILRNKE